MIEQKFPQNLKDKKKLKYCNRCIQMTNHDNDVCCKCGLLRDDSEGE